MIVKNIYISSKTFELFVERREKAIMKYGIKYKIPIALIKAIIKQESGGNFWATRIEKHLKKAPWYKRLLFGIKNIIDYHYCSFGLMQILYGMARHYGFIGSPFKLYDPDIGIKYGVRHLKYLWRRYRGNIKDIISVYNAGSIRRSTEGKYRNQEYVDNVLKFYFEYGGK